MLQVTLIAKLRDESGGGYWVYLLTYRSVFYQEDGARIAVLCAPGDIDRVIIQSLNSQVRSSWC